MSKLLTAFALREARLGNYGPLIGRVLSGAPPTKEEREFIAAVFERLDGKRGKAELRRIEKALIAQRVEGLIEEEDFKPEEAVTKVAKERGRSRAHVYRVSRGGKFKKQR